MKKINEGFICIKKLEDLIFNTEYDMLKYAMCLQSKSEYEQQIGKILLDCIDN